MKPVLLIFAGANGSGKTTAARALLPSGKIVEFVNADEIARGLSPFNPSGQAVQAGKLVLKRIDDLIARRKSFAIETTLSGRVLLAYLRRAKDVGYRVEMNFLFTNDIRTNIARIKGRVRQGGHHVPSADVRRRYWRGLANFAVYSDFCDTINVYGATRGLRLFLHRKQGGLFLMYDNGLYGRFTKRVNDAFRLTGKTVKSAS